MSARFVLPIARVGGKYSMLRRLAVGGMGEVWAARNETTGAQVALKILRPARDERSQAEERFRNEAYLGGMLTHRSIARIYDFLEEPDGTLVLVMELLRGETVEELLERRRQLSAREALAIVVPLLSALQHGHDHGIVHRDVKPANVFLSTEPDGHVVPKLLDFGVAKIPNAGTKTIDGLVLGTPAYMSPEQVRAEPLDGRSDLFAVGVMLYEMLTGISPFKANGPGASIAAVLSNAVDPDPAIAPRLWLELQRALAKRPAERHASASEMSALLCAAIDETENGLMTVLRRTKPPPQPSDFFSSGERWSAGADGADHTPSVQGHSVAAVLPERRTPRWVTIAAAGAVGVIVGIFAITAVGRSRAPATTRAPEVTAVVTPAPLLPAPPAAVPEVPKADVTPAPAATEWVAPKVSTGAPPKRTTKGTAPKHAKGTPPAKSAAKPPIPPPPKSIVISPDF